MASLDPKIAIELPDPVAKALESALRVEGLAILGIRQLTGGFTGALTWVTMISALDAPDEKVVLKISPPTSSPTSEDRAFDNAFAEANDFRKHLVRLARPSLTLKEGWIAIFMKLAGGSIETVRSLEFFQSNRVGAQLARTVIQRTTSGWNASQMRVVPTNSRAFLHEMIGKKYSPDQAFAQLISAMHGPGVAGSPLMLFPEDEDKEPILNLFWLLDNNPDSLDEEVYVVRGWAHGDLHQGNVFIPLESGQPMESNFLLIDLATSSGHNSLARDAANLVMSIIAANLASLSGTAKRQLMNVLIKTFEGEEGNSVDFLAELLDGCYKDTSEYFRTLGLIDDWHHQFRMSVGAMSAVLASRERFHIKDRMWLLEFGGRLLHAIFTPPSWSVYDLGSRIDVKRAKARGHCDELLAEVDHFSSRVATIALVSPQLDRQHTSALTRHGWDLIIEVDQQSQVSGALKFLQDRGERPRVLIPNQTASFGSGRGIWLAARGLVRPGEVSPRGSSMRSWRQTQLRGMKHTLEEFARARDVPFCLVVLGTPDEYCRAIAETIVDSFGDRVNIVQFQDRLDVVNHLDARMVESDIELVIDYLPIKDSPDPQDPICSVPAGPDGGQRLALTSEDVAWYESVGELLHSKVDRGYPAEANGFYRGGVISWGELEDSLDLPRDLEAEILERLHVELSNRGTKRLPLFHLAGAGGTTLARRVAWRLRDSYPVLVTTGKVEPDLLSDRVAELAAASERPIFVVIEMASDVLVDQVYERLRSRLVSATIMPVGRRRRIRRETDRSALQLGMLSSSEEEQFLRHFAAIKPQKRGALNDLSRAEGAKVPFLYALTAYEREFQGVVQYVKASLADCSDRSRRVLTAIALVHNYTGADIPGPVLGSILELQRNRPIDLGAHLSESAFDLLVEVGEGRWKIQHNLIAEEVLRQIAAPHGAVGRGKVLWAHHLSTWSTDLISAVYDAYEDLPPSEVLNTLNALFLWRDTIDNLASGRGVFSELINDLPSLEGKLHVLRVLAETFPSESHYWGHLARLLSYNAKDHNAARDAITHALAVSPEDDALLHMSGVIYRNQAGDLMDTARSIKDGSLGTEDGERIHALCELALDEFAGASELNPVSEYPFVATAQLCIRAIEWGKQTSMLPTYAEFFKQPSSSWFVELLEDAEEALDSLSDIRGDDEMSEKNREVDAQIRLLYDDYDGLIKGWRALLDRNDVDRLAVRRRLARLYRTRYAGGWSHASGADRRSAILLLEKNLRDDPTDFKALREWLRVIRYGGGGDSSELLNRASELVSYWAEESQDQMALFYDYVLSFLLVCEGRGSALRPFMRKVENCRNRAQFRSNRTAVIEWWGESSGLGGLVDSRQLEKWDRKNWTAPDPAPLRRVSATVKSVDTPQSGRLTLSNGIDAFFTPSPAGVVRDRDENTLVTCLIGWSLEGLRAWRVHRAVE